MFTDERPMVPYDKIVWQHSEGLLPLGAAVAASHASDIGGDAVVRR